jgi:hypothetical protein
MRPSPRTRSIFLSVTFAHQKNNHKHETRTQQRTTDDILCPVRAWSSTIIRLASYPNTNDNTPINLVYDRSSPTPLRLSYISQKSTNTLLRLTCRLQPPQHFGYLPTNVGSHSLRSGAAMALFLANEPVHKIMILGRWSSDAFLAYIRPQVQEWTSGMSISMSSIQNFHLAHTAITPNHNIRHRDDPTVQGHHDAFHGPSLHPFHGPNPGHGRPARLHLFH